MTDLGSVPGRVTRAAGVGGGLAFAAVVGAAVVAGTVPCHAEGWGCLGYFMVYVVAALGTAAVLAWPVLHMVKVRPAFPVALCGPLAAGAIGWFSAKAPVNGALAASGWFVEAALGYGIAAFVTAGAVHWPWRVSVALVVAALAPFGNWINTHRAASAYARGLAGAGVPLLAPDLRGYDVDQTMADSSRRTLHYELAPRALSATTSEYERAEETRRGNVLIDVSQMGDSIDEARLRPAATGMSPHPAAYFRSR